MRSLAIALREKARDKRDELKKQAAILGLKKPSSEKAKLKKKKQHDIELAKKTEKPEVDVNTDIESNASTIDNTIGSVKNRSMSKG